MIDRIGFIGHIGVGINPIHEAMMYELACHHNMEDLIIISPREKEKAEEKGIVIQNLPHKPFEIPVVEVYPTRSSNETRAQRRERERKDLKSKQKGYNKLHGRK